MSTFMTCIQRGNGASSRDKQANKRKERNIQIGKKEVKLSLFAADMILSIVHTKKYTQTHRHTHTVRISPAQLQNI